MATYFTTVGGEQGANAPSENPCRLIDFARLVLRDGATHTGQTGEREVLLVLFGGRCSVTAGGKTFENVGKRANPLWASRTPSICRLTHPIRSRRAATWTLASARRHLTWKAEPYADRA